MGYTVYWDYNKENRAAKFPADFLQKVNKIIANAKKNNITFWLFVLLLSLLLVGVSVYFYIHVKTQTETEAYNNAINSNSPVILQDYLNKYGSYDISHHD